MTNNIHKTKKLEKYLIEFERKIINKRNELHIINKKCENEKNNLELKFNDLQVKQKKLSEKGDIQTQVKIDSQYCDELKMLLKIIEQHENEFKKLEDEKKKLNELEKQLFLEKSKIAKEITGIKWSPQTTQSQGFIKNKQNSYVKFFSLKNDGNTNITEKLYTEIQKSASSKWDNFVDEA